MHFFVEKMHTPETKKYHFSKKLACGETPFSYDFNLEQADIILLRMEI